MVTGGIVALFPFAAGLGVITNPLRRAADGSSATIDAAKFVRICPLDALPADGMPREFAVVADASDAWTHAIAQRIGAFFLLDPAKIPTTYRVHSHLSAPGLRRGFRRLQKRL